MQPCAYIIQTNVLLLFVKGVACLLLQYEALATHYKFVTITVYIIMFTVEGARLYLGYEGNLREKVPYTVFA